MSLRIWAGRILPALFLLLPACGESRKKVYPVSGEVFVDGKPAPDAFVFFHPVNQPDIHVPFAQVDENGKFQIATYMSADGIPAGEYIVCFEWRERSGLLKQNFDGPDRLGGRYYDKSKSQYRVTIGKGPMTLDRYDLKSK